MKRKPNNPRRISKKEYAALQADLEEYGDLGGIVHNETTGNLVGGNQRASVFDLVGKGAEIVITAEHAAPTRTGETARGYVVWKGERYDYRRVAWDTAKEDAACIRANLRGGTWDWDMLAGFDAGLLTGAGFDADLLKTLNDDAANLALMLTAETITNNGDANSAGGIRPWDTLTQQNAGSTVRVVIGEIETVLDVGIYEAMAERLRVVTDARSEFAKIIATGLQDENSDC